MIGGVLPRVSSLDFPLNQLLGAQSCWSFASPEPSSSAVTPNSSEIWPICCLGSDIPRAMSNCLACLAKHNLRCYRCTNGPYFRADLPILPIWPMANFELTVTMWLTFGVPTVRNLPQVNTAFKPPMGFHWSRMSLGTCDQKPKMPCCVEKLYENSTQKCKKINQTSIIIQPLFIFLLDAVDAVESYSVWPIAPKSWYCPLPSRPKNSKQSLIMWWSRNSFHSCHSSPFLGGTNRKKSDEISWNLSVSVSSSTNSSSSLTSLGGGDSMGDFGDGDSSVRRQTRHSMLSKWIWTRLVGGNIWKCWLFERFWFWGPVVPVVWKQAQHILNPMLDGSWIDGVGIPGIQ